MIELNDFLKDFGHLPTWACGLALLVGVIVGRDSRVQEALLKVLAEASIPLFKNFPPPQTSATAWFANQVINFVGASVCTGTFFVGFFVTILSEVRSSIKLTLCLLFAGLCLYSYWFVVKITFAVLVITNGATPKAGDCGVDGVDKG